MEQTKQCNKCNEIKPITEFYSYWKEGKVKGKYLYIYPSCSSCESKKAAKWREDNPEKWKQIYTTHDQKPETKANQRRYKKNYREKGEQRKWQHENKDKLSIYGKKRKNKNHIISRKEWKECKNYFENACAYCGMTYDQHKSIFNEDLHKEHVDNEGSIYLDNCIPSCRTCNTSKHDFKFEEWYSKENPNFDQNRLNKILKWLTEDYRQFFEGYRKKRKYKSKQHIT